MDFTTEQNLLKCRDEDIACDGTLVSSDGKPHRVHQVIVTLSASNLFQGERTEETVDLDSQLLEEVIQWIYRRSLLPKHDATYCQKMLLPARQLSIPDLEAECSTRMSKSLTNSNLFEIWSFSHNNGCAALWDECLRFAAANFSLCSHARGLLELPADTFCQLIHLDSLMVANEREVEECVVAKIRHCGLIDLPQKLPLFEGVWYAHMKAGRMSYRHLTNYKHIRDAINGNASVFGPLRKPLSCQYLIQQRELQGERRMVLDILCYEHRSRKLEQIQEICLCT